LARLYSEKTTILEVFGTLVSAATVGLVIFMLNSSYGFTADDYLINQGKFSKEQIEAVHNNTATPDLAAKIQGRSAKKLTRWLLLKLTLWLLLFSRLCLLSKY
jgi:hypothetical protein